MSITIESGTLDGTDAQNSLKELQKMKRKAKKPEENKFNYLKSSVILKGLKLKKNGLKKSNVEKSNTKKVKFNNDISIINVECWKQYNIILTAEENTECLDKDKTKEGKKEKNKKKNNAKKEHISCTCFII